MCAIRFYQSGRGLWIQFAIQRRSQNRLYDFYLRLR